MRRWYAERRVTQTEKQRRYRQENKTAVDARERAYRETHREEARLRARAWTAANPEKVRLQSKRKRQRAKSRERIRSTNARRYRATGSHTLRDVSRQYALQDGCCFWCDVSLRGVFEKDHLIPLFRGGSDGPENLVIACRKCNRSKSAKLPLDWAPKLVKGA
jgi:5-methylcytosine-specific restriction endonuclease McrA